MRRLKGKRGNNESGICKQTVCLLFSAHLQICVSFPMMSCTCRAADRPNYAHFALIGKNFNAPSQLHIADVLWNERTLYLRR